MDLDAATPQDASSHVAGRLVTVNEENFLPSKIRTATRRWTKHGKLPELERAFRGKQTCADCDPGEPDSQQRNRKSPDRCRGLLGYYRPPELRNQRKRSTMPGPDGTAFVVSEDEGVGAFYYFPCENEVDFALLNF
jgi:hypothetical protein